MFGASCSAVPGPSASNRNDTDEPQLVAGQCLTDGQLLAMQYRVIGVFDEASFTPLPPVQCEAGRFETDGKCEECEAGTFQAVANRRDCVNCDLLGDVYQEHKGRTSCMSCAANTQRFVGVGSSRNRSACLCQRNHFQPDRQAGSACVPCLPGATCAGRLAMPIPLAGYVTSYADTRLAIVKCHNSGACLGGPRSHCATGYRSNLLKPLPGHVFASARHAQRIC